MYDHLHFRVKSVDITLNLKCHMIPSKNVQGDLRQGKLEFTPSAGDTEHRQP